MVTLTHEEIYSPWNPIQGLNRLIKEELLAETIDDLIYYINVFIPHHKNIHNISIALMDIDRLLLNCKFALDSVEQAQPDKIWMPSNTEKLTSSSYVSDPDIQLVLSNLLPIPPKLRR